MATILSALALGACSSLQGDGVRSYSLSPGVATYDALRQASETCTGQGGALELRVTGSSERLSDYVCKIANPAATPAVAASSPDAAGVASMLAASEANIFGIKASGTSLKVDGYSPEQVDDVQACLQSTQEVDGLNQCFKSRNLTAVASIDNNGPRGAIEFDKTGRPTAADMAMLSRCVQLTLPDDTGRVQIDSTANLAVVNACLRANNIAHQVIPGSLN